MLPSWFVVIGSLLSLVGSSVYALHTLQGKTSPNQVTWGLWTAAPLIAFAAMVSDGVGLSALMTFSSGFGPGIVFTASFFTKKARWKITRFDYVCAALSVAALIGWYLSSEPLIAVSLAIAADALALLPTLKKSWQHPHTESASPFVAASISALIALLTIDSWQAITFLFPLYIFTLCAALSLIIWLRTKRLDIVRQN